MKPEMAESCAGGDLVAHLRDRGYATCVIPWSVVWPSEVFSLFDALLETALATKGLEPFREVDEILVKRAGDTPLLSTSPMGKLRHTVDGCVGYGHSYFPGTLKAVQTRCTIPRPLAALWVALETMIAAAEPVLRDGLSPLPGAKSLPSAVRIWKYVQNDLHWATPPHYDLTAVSSVLATLNPNEELLTIGLEANGAPIGMVRERTEDLKRFSPAANQFAIVLPGIFSNRWGLEPTWHYVKPLRLPNTCRYSLVWSLIHPPNEPMRPTRHVQDEIAPNQVTWS